MTSPTQTIEQWLEGVEARAKRATPGPWEIKAHPAYRNYQQVSRKDSNDYIFVFNSQTENADFIAHSRTDVERLTQMVRVLVGAIDKSIAIADDYADSAISRPIRDVREQAAALVEGKSNAG